MEAYIILGEAVSSLMVLSAAEQVTEFILAYLISAGGAHQAVYQPMAIIRGEFFASTLFPWSFV